MNGTHHVFDFLEKSSLQDLAGACAIFGSERFLKKLGISNLVKMLVNKSGVRAKIISSGFISVGDKIKIY